MAPHQAQDARDIGEGWKLRLGEVGGASDPAYDDSGWDEVRLPHTFNDSDTFTPTRGYYRGPAWYRKRFMLRRVGRRRFLRFNALWGKARVWLNGEDLGEHADGLVGFELDVTECTARGENVVSVRIDNTPDPDVLPGKPVPDYNVYGGLCGDVVFATKPRSCFPWRSLAITTPDIDDVRARVDLVAGVLGGDAGGKVRGRATVFDLDGREVARTGEVTPGTNNAISLHIEVPSPRLWSPDEPYLYSALVELLEGDKLLDSQTERFGLRTFSFHQDEGFTLNGQRLQLRGVNRHQDFPGLGNVLSERLNRRDAEIIKEMGGNFVRTSHYPQDPSFLDACDDLGVLVYEEITSWQFIGGEGFISNADRMMASMIERDRNHPSVILWGMMNEGRSKKMFDRLKQTAMALDPTRSTIYADNRPGDGVSQGTTFIPHVLGLNYRLETIDAFHSAYPELKLMISEHTNADSTLRGDPELEKTQAERISTDLDLIEARSFVAGSALWSMHDYGTDYEPVWPVQRSGVLDALRVPKEAFFMLSARWRRDPVIFIAPDWAYPHEEDEPVEVRIYTNCQELELTLEGRSLGSWKGKNPLTVELPYARGALRAFGVKEGYAAVSSVVTPPGPPAKLELSCPSEIRADGKDCGLATASLLDAGDNPVLGVSGRVEFELTGPARLKGIGEGVSAEMVAGTACIPFRSTGRRGRVVVKARFQGLESAAISIRAP
jgi:beta-galactosidase